MFNEQPPSYGAASQGLAATYTINLNTDLQHFIPLTSSWQGDPVKAKTLYVNNYQNNFDINITNGRFSTIVPALSTGYIDVSSFDSITISSEVIGILPIAVYNFTVPVGFSSRGVAPNVAVSNPFAVAGTINIASNNSPDILLYQPSNGMLYAICNVSKIIIKINPNTNAIVSVKPTSKNVSAACIGPNDTILFGTTDGNYIIYDTLAETESAPVLVDSGSRTLINIAYSISSGGKVYANINSAQPFRFDYNGTNVSGLIGIDAFGKIVADVNGDIYGGNSSGVLGKIVGLGITTITIVGGITSLYKHLGGSLGNVYVGIVGNIKSYTNGLVNVGSDIGVGGTPQVMALNSSNARLAVGSSNGTIAMIDIALKGVVGTVPNIGAAVISMAYAENAGRMYAGISTGSISYINN